MENGSSKGKFVDAREPSDDEERRKSNSSCGFEGKMNKRITARRNVLTVPSHKIGVQEPVEFMIASQRAMCRCEWMKGRKGGTKGEIAVDARRDACASA